MEFSKRMKLFGDEIFAALNDKKVALEAQGRTIYNLSVGTPDFAPAPHIRQALLDAAADPENWKYSLRDIPEMLQAVCSYYKRRFGVDITPDQVASCNGSQEGCGHIGMVLCDEGDTVLLPNPCYPVFIAGAKLAGAVPFYYPLVKEHGFLPYVKGIPEDVARRAKYMIVSLPANPVGSVGTPALYEELVAFAKKYDILLIHDNAYSDIIFDGAEGHSLFNTPGAMDMGVEFFSLSKSFDVTGARISFLVGRPDVVAAFRRLRGQIDFGMFLPIQKAAIAALTGPPGHGPGSVRRLPAAPGRPVRRPALHRLGCARQPRQHVRLGAHPAQVRQQYGFLHGPGGKKRRAVHPGLQLWPRGRRLRPLCPDHARRADRPGGAGHCRKRHPCLKKHSAGRSGPSGFFAPFFCLLKRSALPVRLTDRSGCKAAAWAGPLQGGESFVGNAL